MPSPPTLRFAISLVESAVEEGHILRSTPTMNHTLFVVERRRRETHIRAENQFLHTSQTSKTQLEGIVIGNRVLSIVKGQWMPFNTDTN